MLIITFINAVRDLRYLSTSFMLSMGSADIILTRSINFGDNAVAYASWSVIVSNTVTHSFNCLCNNWRGCFVVMWSTCQENAEDVKHAGKLPSIRLRFLSSQDSSRALAFAYSRNSMTIAGSSESFGTCFFRIWPSNCETYVAMFLGKTSVLSRYRHVVIKNLRMVICWLSEHGETLRPNLFFK